jgi:hypothetical protein
VVEEEREGGPSLLLQQDEDEAEQPHGRLKAKQRERETLFQERFVASSVEPPARDKVDDDDSTAVDAEQIHKESGGEEEEKENVAITEDLHDDLEAEIMVPLAPGQDTSSLVSPRSESTSSSPTFESIYDISAPEEEEEQVLDPTLANASSVCSPSGGARPKESSSANPVAAVVKVATVPAESPPPYSEVDPMSSSTVTQDLDSAASSTAAADNTIGQLVPECKSTSSRSVCVSARP